MVILILIIVICIIITMIVANTNNHLTNKSGMTIESCQNKIMSELTNSGISAVINCSLLDGYLGEIIIPNHNNKAILLDETKQFFIIVDFCPMEYIILPFSSILNCEIIENENTVNNPSIGNAIIGGVIAGGAGAIIGSNMSKTTNNVKSLRVRIITSDLANPLIFIDLITAEIPRHTSIYTNCLEYANRVYAICFAIIDKNQRH